MTNFKKEYLTTDISFEAIHDWIEKWHKSSDASTLQEFLGLSDSEMQLVAKGDGSLKRELDLLRKTRVASKLKKALSKLVKE